MITPLAGRSLAVLAGLALLLASCGQQPQPAPQPHSVKLTGSGLGALVTDGRWVWVPNMNDGTVTKVDARTDAVVSTIPVANPKDLYDQGCNPDPPHAYFHGSWYKRGCDSPSAIAAGAGALWAADNGQRQVVRVDPASDRVVARVQLPIRIWGVAAAEGTVWVTDFWGDAVAAIDAVTNSVRAVLSDLPAGPASVLAVPGAVWVVDSRAGQLTRIDPRTATVVATIPIEPLGPAIAGDAGTVWVRVDNGGYLTRVEAATNQVVANLPVGPTEGGYGIDGIAALADGAWLSGIRVRHVDARSNRLDRTLPSDALSVAAVPGHLWAATISGRLVHFRLS